MSPLGQNHIMKDAGRKRELTRLGKILVNTTFDWLTVKREGHGNGSSNVNHSDFLQPVPM